MMLAAFSLTSCSSDDNEEFLMDQLSGTWEQVYDEGVVAEGYVQYTFTPGKPATVGECTIHVYDVFTGDTTLRHDICDNKSMFVLGFSYDLSTGKNLKINRKLQNKDSDTGSF